MSIFDKTAGVIKFAPQICRLKGVFKGLCALNTIIAVEAVVVGGGGGSNGSLSERRGVSN